MDSDEDSRWPAEPAEPGGVGVSAPKSMRLGALGARCSGGPVKALSPKPSSCTQVFSGLQDCHLTRTCLLIVCMNTGKNSQPCCSIGHTHSPRLHRLQGARNKCRCGDGGQMSTSCADRVCLTVPAGRVTDERELLFACCGGAVDGCSPSGASLKASAGGHSSPSFAYSPLYCTDKTSLSESSHPVLAA